LRKKESKMLKQSGFLRASMPFATLLIAFALSTGCAKPAAYKAPIVKYQLASTVVIENARVEYAEANDRERAAVVAKAVQNRQRLDLTMLSGDGVTVLDGEGIAARMSALNALSKHGELLLALASSDAPERSRSAANSLGAALVDLQASLATAPSDEFKNKATGFAAIAGEIVRFVLEKRITEALDRSIIASEADVEALIGLIRRDMGLLYERRKSMLSAERVAAIDEYNEARAQVDREALKAAAAQVLRTEQAWDQLALLQGAGPSLDAMSQAHRMLVEYARGPKRPQDLADLVEAIESFVSRVSIIADAIKLIRSE
jgi:hypothetical protein